MLSAKLKGSLLFPGSPPSDKVAIYREQPPNSNHNFTLECANRLNASSAFILLLLFSCLNNVYVGTLLINRYWVVDRLPAMNPEVWKAVKALLNGPFAIHCGEFNPLWDPNRHLVDMLAGEHFI